MAKLRQKERRSPWKSLDIQAVGNFRVQVLDKIGLPDISGKRCELNRSLQHHASSTGRCNTI